MLNKGTRAGFTEQLLLEQRLEGGEESTTWGKNILGKGTRWCKGQCGNTDGDKCLWNREHMKERMIRTGLRGLRLKWLSYFCFFLIAWSQMKMFLIYGIILCPSLG